MNVTITIDTDNAAFHENGDHPGGELARILRDVADDHALGLVYDRGLRDVNGNTVGKVVVDG